VTATVSEQGWLRRLDLSIGGQRWPHERLCYNCVVNAPRVFVEGELDDDTIQQVQVNQVAQGRVVYLDVVPVTRGQFSVPLQLYRGYNEIVCSPFDASGRSYSQRLLFRSGLREWLETLVCAIIFALIIKTFVIQPFYIPSQSMEKTLAAGDRIMVSRLDYAFSDPERKDIIVFEYPRQKGRYFVKRILGLPRERLEIVDSKVFVDGRSVTEPYVKRAGTTMGISSLDNYRDLPPVPAAGYFVMGDNRDFSASQNCRTSIFHLVSPQQNRVDPMSGKASVRRRDAVRGQVGAIRRELQSANLIFEVRDARAPLLTSVERLLGRQAAVKRRGIVLTKADLAEDSCTRQWLEWFEKHERPAIAVDLGDTVRSGRAIRRFVKELVGSRTGAAKLSRVAVVGLPNVGKSTIINRMVGHKRAKVGNRPGITRGRQWVRVGEGVVVLDTPGVIQLFAGIEKALGAAFFKLALCNVVPAVQYEDYDCIERLLVYLRSRFDVWPFSGYRAPVFEKLWSGEISTIEEVFEEYAQRDGLRGRGGIADVSAAVSRIMSDFQRGKLSPLSLEFPPEGGTLA